MLQAMSDDAGGAAASDFTLFTPWSSAWPPNDAARRAWQDRLSESVFRGEPEGLPDYPRFRFSESDARQQALVGHYKKAQITCNCECGPSWPCRTAFQTLRSQVPSWL